MKVALDTGYMIDDPYKVDEALWECAEFPTRWSEPTGWSPWNFAWGV